MSFTLLLPILLAGEPARPAVAATDDPPLRIWISNDGRFVRGDRAKVQVWAEDDGYLVVLQTDTEGHLRVLFPTDPTDDSFLRGGKKYEVKSRGGRDAFDVGSRTGTGTVYAAVSRAPFHFDQFSLSGHWDYNALESQPFAENPESELTELVRRMAQGNFDYDLMNYYVVESVVYASDSYYSSPGYYYGGFGCGYYSCGSGFSVSLSFGYPYYHYPYYRPYYYPYYPAYYYPSSYYYYPYYRPYYPAYYYPRYYYGGYHPYRWGYPYRPRVNPYNGYGRNQPYSPYRFRDRTLAGADNQDRRYTFGQAVNTVHVPPKRFGEAETSSRLRRTLERDVATRSEPTLTRRRASETSVSDRGEARRATERRTETGTIDARRARPAESPRTSDTRNRREAMPVDATPRRSGSDQAGDRTARRSSEYSLPVDATARRSRSSDNAMPVDVTARRSRSSDAPDRTARRSGDTDRPMPTRAEPRAEPRSEPRATRAEPRAEPRSSGSGDRGGWNGGDGGRRSGGGGGSLGGSWGGGGGGGGGGSSWSGGGVSSSGGGRRR